LDQRQGGVPQNDRAFASLSIATQSAEYTTCAKTSPLKKLCIPKIPFIGFQPNVTLLHYYRLVIATSVSSS
jgi:hypothetical protein